MNMTASEIKNKRCHGQRCRFPNGDVRLVPMYPGNAILCLECFQDEMGARVEYAKGKLGMRIHTRGWEELNLPNWFDLALIREEPETESFPVPPGWREVAGLPPGWQRNNEEPVQFGQFTVAIQELRREMEAKLQKLTDKVGKISKARK